jgi:hypothetical protein
MTMKFEHGNVKPGTPKFFTGTLWDAGRQDFYDFLVDVETGEREVKYWKEAEAHRTWSDPEDK